MSDEGQIFWIGVFVAVFLAFIAFHTVEATCQEFHNVADCEWSRTPFTPAIPDEAAK